MSFASQSALPGDALYPVKRAIENAQTGLSSGDDKTEGILGNASARLDEVAALSDRGTAESDTQVPGTIHDFTEQAQEGARRAVELGRQPADHGPARVHRGQHGAARVARHRGARPGSRRARLRGEARRHARPACPDGLSVLWGCRPRPAADLPHVGLGPGQTAPGQIVPSDPRATGQPSSGPSAGVPSGGLPTTSTDAPTGPGLPTSTGNGPLDDLTDRVLPTVTTSGLPDLPDLPDPPDLPGPPATSPLDEPLDDVTGGLGDLLDP